MIDFTVYLIAISLVIDCFAVCVCISGIKKLKTKHYFEIPLHFAFFQSFMTIIGFYIGISLLDLIKEIDHWIAFILLSIIGIKMIWESRDGECKIISDLSEKTMIILSISTSIDALVMGITFSIVDGPIWYKSLIIGIFTLVFSILGLILGKRLRRFKVGHVGFLGGIVLIGIGLKILFGDIL
ncbi:MAG: manganese efflux pump MntP family protein [Candidatus Pacearchaeota archaeon]|jgi:putative Mn2+ efflux pump MntP